MPYSLIFKFMMNGSLALAILDISDGTSCILGGLQADLTGGSGGAEHRQQYILFSRAADRS